jgi:hypothetical protein
LTEKAAAAKEAGFSEDSKRLTLPVSETNIAVGVEVTPLYGRERGIAVRRRPGYILFDARNPPSQC